MIKYNLIVQTLSCLFALIMQQNATLDNSCKPSKSGYKIMKKYVVLLKQFGIDFCVLRL